MKKKVAYLGLLLAAALICSYIESLIPFYFGVPGMKLGLTNVVVIFVMYLIGPVEAITVSVLRVLISGFMFGNVFSILYSSAMRGKRSDCSPGSIPGRYLFPSFSDVPELRPPLWRAADGYYTDQRKQKRVRYRNT